MDTALFLVCRFCHRSYAAEHGFNDNYCSELCESQMTLDIHHPDDDDGQDGLPYDPETLVRHCVFLREGCNLDAITNPEWRTRAELLTQGRWCQGCICYRSHTVLSRQEVYDLREAGFIVEVSGYCYGSEDLNDYEYDDYRDYDDFYLDDWMSPRAPELYLQGRLDPPGPEESLYDHMNDNGYPEPGDPDWDADWNASQRAEDEVLEDMGFHYGPQHKEFYEDDVPSPHVPVFRVEPSMKVQHVGVFDITPEVNPAIYGTDIIFYQVTHLYGGLVPTITGTRQHESKVTFFTLQSAIEHANWAMSTLGVAV